MASIFVDSESSRVGNEINACHTSVKIPISPDFEEPVFMQMIFFLTLVDGVWPEASVAGANV